jgi:hypothetical protein
LQTPSSKKQTLKPEQVCNLLRNVFVANVTDGVANPVQQNTLKPGQVCNLLRNVFVANVTDGVANPVQQNTVQQNTLSRSRVANPVQQKTKLLVFDLHIGISKSG